MKNVKLSRTRLTPGEMEIISLLWQHDSLTLAETHEAFDRPIGYTTVQTRLNRLVDKNLVHRSDDRPASYSPAISQSDISADQLDTLLERVTGGNVVPLVAHLVQDRRLSKNQINELKQLIRDAEHDQKSKEKKQ